MSEHIEDTDEYVVIDHLHEDGRHAARRVSGDLWGRRHGQAHPQFMRALEAAEKRVLVAECFEPYFAPMARLTPTEQAVHALKYGSVDLDDEDVRLLIEDLQPVLSLIETKETNDV